MNGDRNVADPSATPSNGDIVWQNGEPYVVFLFDADECEAVAGAMPSGDVWTHDLLEAAQEIRRLTRDSVADAER